MKTKDIHTLNRLLEIACGAERDKCECEIVAEVGQTDFIPTETTKITCKRKIYPYKA